MSIRTRNDSAVDLIVVGGGIIGLAVAWRSARLGMSVRVLERGSIGCGASSVAAGMLAPVSEVELGEHGRRTLDLALQAAAAWPAFAQELQDAAGCEVGMRRTGLLMVARDDDEARELERQIAFRESLGAQAERLLPAAARELESALAPNVRLALRAPGDHSVDPRRAIAALRRACEAVAVDVHERTPFATLLMDDSGKRALGVRAQDGCEYRAARVVLAAGAWSGALDGLPTDVKVPVRPVRGEVLRLRDPDGPGLVHGPLRCPDCYIVPREDGAYVLGATMEERGFDATAGAGATYELLRAGQELVPGISELALEEVIVGFRPGTPDNAPFIGSSAIEGLIWATGHFRNGILMAPLTAQMVCDLLSDHVIDPLRAQICRPDRFAEQAANSLPAGSATSAGDAAAARSSR